jgi:hypothetical protein
VAVFSRVNLFKGDPSKIDDAVSDFESNGFSEIEQLDGYVGFRIMVDRDGGEVMAVGFFDSEEARQASEDKVKDARARFAENVGMTGEAEVHRYEIVFDRQNF